MNRTEIINTAYKIGCFVGTVCIICFLFEQYIANEDTSIVLIKKFSECNKSSFPAITLCFRCRWSNNLYDNQSIVSATGLTSKEYRDTMMGDINMSHASGLDKLKFEEATLKLQNYLKRMKPVLQHQLHKITELNIYQQAR